MIYKVEGDILQSRAEVIAHGVAPNDDFKNGLALSLREAWPSMYKDFRHFCQTSHPKAGSLWTWTGADSRRIICLFTQDGVQSHHGGRPGQATLQNVGHCLKALRKEITTLGVKSMALPRLATGVGGLDWNDVEPLITEALGPVEIPVYVYHTYHKGISAKE